MAETKLLEPVELAYDKYGPSTGVEHSIPIVTFHGLFSCKEHWLDTPKRLAELSKRTVYICNFRDHPGSPFTDCFTYEAMISDAVHFFKKNHIEKAICIGHSLGGLMFSRLATLFPHLVEKLVLLDIHPYHQLLEEGDPVEGLALLFYKIRETVREEKLDLDAAKVRASEMLAPFIPEEVRRQFFLMSLGERDGKLDWKFNIDQIIKFLKAKFKMIKPMTNTQTLEIYGEKSDFLSDKDLASILDLLPNTKFEKIIGADHALQLTHPNEFLEIVVPYINS